MSMYKILCVTNQHLAGRDFPAQLARIAAAGAEGIILREKDLGEAAYRELAKQIRRAGVPLIAHTYVKTAQELGIGWLHLSYEDFLALGMADREAFSRIGVSIHSVKEAKEVWRRGASYVTAGHIYATDCKKGVPPRGIGFLEEVCRAVEIPVYAIGGIRPDNAGCCIRAGAAGVCLMSSLMKAEDPQAFLGSYFSSSSGRKYP